MLTRIITGEKNKDFVVNGLDLRGVNNVDSEVLDTPSLIEEHFPTQNSFDTNWTAQYFEWDSITKSALGDIPAPEKSATIFLKSKLDPVNSDIGKWFKVSFKLSNTPKRLYIEYGSEIKIYDHPTSGTYTFYIQLYNNGNVFNSLTFTADLDDLDTTSDHIIYIDDIVLTRVINPANEIDPIAFPNVEMPDAYQGSRIDPTNIPMYLLHPHQSLNITTGVCIKDETMINFTGLNPGDASAPLLNLNYLDPNSWISGTPFEASDFPVGQETFYTEDGAAASSATFDSNGNLSITLFDDGEQETPPPTYYRKIVGNTEGTTPAHVKWAYVCVYYSYFKNPDPNKAFIGLAKESEINDARYGEDYLILGKLRFVDVSTVDAIIYYPERKDWGFIDATRVTYLHLNNLKHWLDKPVNASIALDMLSDRIYNFKGTLYFQTHQSFLDWTGANSQSKTSGLLANGLNTVIGSGTGHGPKEYLQWKNGMDPDNGYDLLAFVLDTNTMWKSRILTTGEINTATILNTGSGYTNGTYTNISFVGGGGSAAKATVTVLDGIITSVTVTSTGSNYKNFPLLDLSGLGPGSDARVVGDLTPSLNNYDLQILWEEVQQKRFEINWSLQNSGSWPSSLPSNWTWHSLSDDDDVDVDPQPAFKTIFEAQSAWPNEFYVERAIGPGNYTIVNPFNPAGKGMVPGPRTDQDDVKFNKFLRSDGTWQPTRGGAVVVDSYYEMCLWYHNASYDWNPVGGSPLTKVGRIPETDYDIMIFVKEDNSLWITPDNPVELYGEDYRGYNWSNILESGKTITGVDPTGELSWPTNIIACSASTRNQVPRCIKPIQQEFEVCWANDSGTLQDAWTSVITNASFKTISVVNGRLTISAGPSFPVNGFPNASTIEYAKHLYPKYAYVIENSITGGSFRLVNPWNPSGNGLVPGPTTTETIENKFLRSDGIWQPIRGGAVVVDSYYEMCLWYHNASYGWDPIGGSPLTKVGRIPEIDYDVMIFVKEDNSLWVTPNNPVELYGKDYKGYNWSNTLESGKTITGVDPTGELSWPTDTIACSASTRNQVPRCIKPIQQEFEICWANDSGTLQDAWTLVITNASFKTISVVNGRLTISAGPSFPVNGFPNASTIEYAKHLYPKYAYVIENSITGGSFRLVNPWNPSGNGLVPGPTTTETIENKFLRSDGIWQPIRGGAVVVDSYYEMCLWYHNASYGWDPIGGSPLTKVGRIPEIDYDVMIFVKEDNSLWVTPNNPVELYGKDYKGYNWGDTLESGKTITGVDPTGELSWPTDTIACSASTRANVARCIKPIIQEFEVRWTGTAWSTITGAPAVFKAISVVNGALTVTPIVGGGAAAIPVGYTPATNIEHAKHLYPKYAYVIENAEYAGSFRIINPYNPNGNGLVPGPVTAEVQTNKFLASDGTWKNAGAVDLHFEVKGHVIPTDKLVQGVMARTSALKGVHIYSDSDITSTVGNGLKIDILVTRGGVTKSIFNNSTYSNGSWTVGDKLQTGLAVPEIHA
jgi:hypothetical protein